MEQSEDEVEESEDKPEGRPVSIAVHAEPKQDGSGEQEFHLQLDKEPTDTTNDDGKDDELVQSSTTVRVGPAADSSQAKVLYRIM